MKYQLTQNARRDIVALLRHTRAEFGLRVMGELDRKLAKTFTFIGDFPHHVRQQEEFTNRPMLFFPVPPFWIVYRLRPNFVEIVGVVHSARDMRTVLHNYE